MLFQNTLLVKKVSFRWHSNVIEEVFFTFFVFFFPFYSVSFLVNSFHFLFPKLDGMNCYAVLCILYVKSTHINRFKKNLKKMSTEFFFRGDSAFFCSCPCTVTLWMRTFLKYQNGLKFEMFLTFLRGNDSALFFHQSDLIPS